MNLDSLYQEIILDHYKKPLGSGLQDNFSGEAFHNLFFTGDRVMTVIKPLQKQERHSNLQKTRV